MTRETEQRDVVYWTCARCGIVTTVDSDATPDGWALVGDTALCPRHLSCADPPCPLTPGLHFWIWPGGKGEGWKTAREQADRARMLGAVGVIPQSGLVSPAWLEGRDPGESMRRYEIFEAQGLQVTAGLGFDGQAATRQAISTAILRALAIARVNVMADWESERKWETAAGRLLAEQIDEDVLTAEHDAFMRCVDCPWWKPLVHRGAPDAIFHRLFLYRFVQAYGAHGPSKNDETTWMLAEARREYPQRGIAARYVLPAEQMYQKSLKDAGRLLLSGEPVIALWDIEEADAIFLAALRARTVLRMNRFALTVDGLKEFQHAASIVASGVLDGATLRAMNVAAPAGIA